MPRGVKKALDFNGELKLIDEQIAELQRKREEVVGKKKEAELNALSSFLEAHEISMSDALDILNIAIAASKATPPTEV